MCSRVQQPEMGTEGGAEKVWFPLSVSAQAQTNRKEPLERSEDSSSLDFHLVWSESTGNRIPQSKVIHVFVYLFMVYQKGNDGKTFSLN